MPDDVVEQVQRLTLTADGMNAVFDVPCDSAQVTFLHLFAEEENSPDADACKLIGHSITATPWNQFAVSARSGPQIGPVVVCVGRYGETGLLVHTHELGIECGCWVV